MRSYAFTPSDYSGMPRLAHDVLEFEYRGTIELTYRMRYWQWLEGADRHTVNADESD